MRIRTFREQDRPALRRLAVRAGQGSPTETLWGHQESESLIYLEPYMDREPESLFLAESDGELLGYLTGCVDTESFPSEDQRIADAVRRYRLVLRRRPALFFARSAFDAASAALRRAPSAGEIHDPRWPAHLHINVVPEARGTGAADGLMEHWFDRLRSMGSPGCYLQTLVENTRAVRFFERMGFAPHGTTPPVPGMRYQGKRVHQQTMVRSC
ncbi:MULTISPECIES: GNAT family N-acetyltransferase [Nocardia]|uniref:GNAT family N-acetyltransferase n=1 Tax=Nocardia TaxID=1817 RepID=UPI0018933A46|nr:MULTISPECIES: GNAT family N-acetyltransferase [Nocardia]MBF6351713.1 GNAT family N-acetyltransferase [Nocardia flavorosea]